jgi:hypothetical protein
LVTYLFRGLMVVSGYFQPGHSWQVADTLSGNGGRGSHDDPASEVLHAGYP